MRTVNVNQVDFQVLPRSDYAAIVTASREDRSVLVAHSCVVCGDEVIGEIEAENSPQWECRCMEHEK